MVEELTTGALLWGVIGQGRVSGLLRYSPCVGGRRGDAVLVTVVRVGKRMKHGCGHAIGPGYNGTLALNGT